MSLEGGEGRGGEGRGGEGRGGDPRDDCYTYYSDGTIKLYRPTMKNYIYITMTSRIT